MPDQPHHCPPNRNHRWQLKSPEIRCVRGLNRWSEGPLSRPCPVTQDGTWHRAPPVRLIFDKSYYLETARITFISYLLDFLSIQAGLLYSCQLIWVMKLQLGAGRYIILTSQLPTGEMRSVTKAGLVEYKQPIILKRLAKQIEWQKVPYEFQQLPNWYITVFYILMVIGGIYTRGNQLRVFLVRENWIRIWGLKDCPCLSTIQLICISHHQVLPPIFTRLSLQATCKSTWMWRLSRKQDFVSVHRLCAWLETGPPSYRHGPADPLWWSFGVGYQLVVYLYWWGLSPTLPPEWAPLAGDSHTLVAWLRCLVVLPCYPHPRTRFFTVITLWPWILSV